MCVQLALEEALQEWMRKIVRKDVTAFFSVADDILEYADKLTIERQRRDADRAASL
jgi:hypothetical protein